MWIVCVCAGDGSLVVVVGYLPHGIGWENTEHHFLASDSFSSWWEYYFFFFSAQRMLHPGGHCYHIRSLRMPSRPYPPTPEIGIWWGGGEGLGFPDGASGKESTCRCRRHKRCGFHSWVGKIPGRRAWQTHSSILAWRIPWTEESGGL